MKKKTQIKTQLKSHYGIGKIQSKLICNQLGISSNLQDNQTTKYEKKRIMDYLRKRMRIVQRTVSLPKADTRPWRAAPGLGLLVEPTSNRITGGKLRTIWLSNLKKINKSPIVDNLKYIQKNNILDLIQKNTYRGFRHKKGLPVRGQRTRTNSQTRRRLARKQF